jgi:hypothetical protein
VLVDEVRILVGVGRPVELELEPGVAAHRHHAVQYPLDALFERQLEQDRTEVELTAARIALALLWAGLGRGTVQPDLPQYEAHLVEDDLVVAGLDQ